MDDIRRNAIALSKLGKIDILQKGAVLSEEQIQTMRGPIRLRIAADDASLKAE